MSWSCSLGSGIFNFPIGGASAMKDIKVKDSKAKRRAALRRPHGRESQQEYKSITELTKEMEAK